MSQKAFSKIWILVVVIIVVAVGVLVYQQLQKSVEKVRVPPEEKIETQPAVGETTDWKTYRNEKYGFEVKYPKEWLAQEKGVNIFFVDSVNKDILHPSGVITLQLSIEESSFSSVKEWFSEHYRVGPNRPKELIPEYSNLSVGHGQAIKFTDPISIGGCHETIALIKYSRLFKWYRFPGTCTYPDEIFEQMLSTFRFLE